LAILDIEPPEALWPETKGQAASLARIRAPDIVDRLRSVTSLVTWFFLVFPDISLHVVTLGGVKIDAR
jgi:hypothetical protein